MQPRLIITRANGKCVIDTSVEEDKAIMITVVPAMPHTAFVTVGALNAALQQYMKDGCKGPAAPKEEGAPTGNGGYLDKAAVLKALYGEDQGRYSPEDAWDLLRRRIERGEFDVCISGEALAKKDAKIEHLKDEIEKRNVIIQDHCAEIARLKKHYEECLTEINALQKENIAFKDRVGDLSVRFDAQRENIRAYQAREREYRDEADKLRNLLSETETAAMKNTSQLEDRIATQGRSIGNYQSRCARQDQEIKDLREALRKAEKAVKCDGCHPKPCSGCRWENERCKYRPYAKGDHSCRYFEEPPKDEPELWICPYAAADCEKSKCRHGIPHEHIDECDKEGAEYCGKACIPVKKPTVPQEPVSVPKTDMEYLSARMMELEQHQGRDRADLMAEIRDLIKSTGDLEIRLDNAESAIQKIQENKA